MDAGFGGIDKGLRLSSIDCAERATGAARMFPPHLGFAVLSPQGGEALLYGSPASDRGG
jgi:hypothetical protein